MVSFATTVLTAPLGKTYLFFVGQAGYIMKSANGKLLGIDLYLSDSVERLENDMGYKRLQPKILDACELKFDVVIATHTHWDHFDPDTIPDLIGNSETHLLASVNCEEEVRALDIVSDYITYVKPGDTFEIGDFYIQFVNCDHGESAPDAVGLIVEADGKTILETGDTCLHLEFCKEYLSCGVPDILIGPINGAFGNMNEYEFAQLSGMIKAGITIPCHYGMFAAHGGSPEKFLEEMKEKYTDCQYLLMSPGEMRTL